MAVFDSVVDGQCTCGARGGWKCVCDVPIYRKRVAPMERWRGDAMFLLHRENAMLEAKQERRGAKQNVDLRWDLGRGKFYRPNGTAYARSSQEVIDWLKKGYSTLAEVEDVRLLAAFWATAGDMESFIDLFLPYLEVTG